MTIAWTIDHGDYPDKLPERVSQMWMRGIQYEGGTPKLVNRKLILDSSKLPFKANLETLNFCPPDEKELTFSAYSYQGREVMGVKKREKLRTTPILPLTRNLRGFSRTASSRSWNTIATIRKALSILTSTSCAWDGSGQIERVTYFNDYPGYKASNPVLSDDGRFIAFQMARVGNPAGVGRGIFIYDIDKAAKRKPVTEGPALIG